jgi:hypothetical protein
MMKTAWTVFLSLKTATSPSPLMRMVVGWTKAATPRPRGNGGHSARMVLASLVAALGILPASQAGAQVVSSPLADLPACERLVADVYQGRLPMTVAGRLLRRAVSCLPGQTKAVLIHHEDHVQENVPAHDVGRIQASVQLAGRENPLVRLRCSQPAFRELLGMADVEFRLIASDTPLGTIRITSDMCGS